MNDYRELLKRYMRMVIQEYGNANLGAIEDEQTYDDLREVFDEVMEGRKTVVPDYTSLPEVTPNEYIKVDGEFKGVVLDLETMGTSNRSAIISIGAVGFDHKYNMTGYFYTPVGLQSSIDLGLEVDVDTQNWWRAQSDEAKAGLNLLNGMPIIVALQAFKAWINEQDVEMWGNGPEFDNTILDAAYRLAGKKTPWNFWNNHSLRTLRFTKTHHTIDNDLQYIKHHALHDAWVEFIEIQDYYKCMPDGIRSVSVHDLLIRKYGYIDFRCVHIQRSFGLIVQTLRHGPYGRVYSDFFINAQNVEELKELPAPVIAERIHNAIMSGTIKSYPYHTNKDFEEPQVVTL